MATTAVMQRQIYGNTCPEEEEASTREMCLYILLTAFLPFIIVERTSACGVNSL